MKLYNKLIRDRIPEIIEASGRSYEVRVLDSDTYMRMLDEKLNEELQEYYQAGEIDKLADLVEVVYAIVKHKNVSIEEFDARRRAKRTDRGGFDKRIMLVSTTE